MAVQVSYPGVYIDEFAPGAPIEGVGTSTAAFIGVAASGDMETPTRITKWRTFRDEFGEHPLPGFYLWYAVRGFFDNGGRVCYIVRASNGEYPDVLLQDRAGNDLVTVRARDPGVPAPAINVEVRSANRLQAANTSLYQPAGAYTVIGLREVDLTNAAEAAQFKPGDLVDLGAAGARLEVTRVTDKAIRLGANVNAAIGAQGAIRLADAPKGAQTVRIHPNPNAPIPDGVLVPGTMLTITQGPVSDTQVVQGVQGEQIDPANLADVTYRVTFRAGLNAPFSMDPANAGTVQSEEFDILLSQGNSTIPYNNLGADPAHPLYYVRTINSLSRLAHLELVEPPPADSAPGSLPAATGGPVPLAGGKQEDRSTMTGPDYIRALDTLREVDDVNLVAIPDAGTLKTAAVAPAVPQPDANAITALQQAMITHCEQLADRFAVLDSRAGLDLFTAGAQAGVDTQRRSLDSTRGYAALYYPWLRVSPDGPGQDVVVPPSGHVCGIVAQSDLTRGVFKAPANYLVGGSIGVERTMSNDDQGLLNLMGINVIRVFNTGERPKLWGARTTATDKNWQYVNIRRLFLFLEESIQEGILWAVFEPNNLALWQKLRLSIRAFLLQQWRDGALFGATPEEAFYVRIDEDLNPFSEQALGRLHIEIGVRPSYPAEFIVVHIGIWQGGGQVSEG